MKDTPEYKIGFNAGWSARERMLSPAQGLLKAEQIVGAICGFFDLDPVIIKDVTRVREIVYPRQLCMYFLRKYTILPLKYIGLLFGGKDHTSVIHSIETIGDLLCVDENVKHDVALLERALYELAPIEVPYEILESQPASAIKQER